MPCIRFCSNQSKSTVAPDIGEISCGNTGAVSRFFREPRAQCALVRVKIPASSRLPPYRKRRPPDEMHVMFSCSDGLFVFSVSSLCGVENRLSGVCPGCQRWLGRPGRVVSVLSKPRRMSRSITRQPPTRRAAREVQMTDDLSPRAVGPEVTGMLTGSELENVRPVRPLTSVAARRPGVGR
jgi:hypothetical protein